MIAVTVVFTLKPGRWEDFLPLMTENARQSLAVEAGCHQFDICLQPGADTVFLYELYDDRAAFDLHLASPHFLAFDAAVSEMIASKDVRLFEKVIR